MATALRTAIAVPFTLDGSQSITVDDGGTGSPRTFTLSAGTYRVFLAHASGGTPGVNTGTETDPHELLSQIEYRANLGSGGSYWNVRMGSGGKVVTSALQASCGAMDFSGAPIVQAALGMTGSPFFGGVGSQTADYPPQCFATTFGAINDTGWTVLPQASAISTVPTGAVVGLRDGYNKSHRRWDACFHPRTQTDKTNKPLLTGTVMMPVSWALEQNPTRVLDGDTAKLPWSLYETIQASAFVQIAVAHGNFQDLISGSSSSFDICYLDEQTITAKEPIRPSSPTIGFMSNYTGIGLYKYGVGAR